MPATKHTHAWSIRTLGVDLAAQPGDTGVAVIDWNENGAKVTRLHAGFEGTDGDSSAWESADDEIIRLASNAQIVGIDVPFGWPITFQRFLEDDPNPLTELGAASGVPPVPGDPEWRRLLQFRRTDLLVRQHPDFGIWPMAVTSNKIAVTAMRATVLLARLQQEGHHPHRDGSGDIVEVYPAAALKKWGLPHRGYKDKKGALKRHDLVDALFGPRKAGTWLTVSGQHQETCRTSDDALDAVLCALIAGARLAGAWITPDSEWAGSDGIAVQRLTDHDREAVTTEGWIVLPTVDLAVLHSTVAAYARSSTSRPR